MPAALRRPVGKSAAAIAILLMAVACGRSAPLEREPVGANESQTAVLTVPGMFAALGPLVGKPDTMSGFYRSECTTVGATLPTRVAPNWGPIGQVSEVKYRNFLPWGQIDGAKKLDQALHAVPGRQRILVMSHSMGSYAVWVWLRDYAPSSDIDPARVVFVMSGVANAMKDAPHLLNSRYRVFDVILQWEKYSDPPTVRSSRFFADAETNADRLDLHTRGYGGVSLNSAPAAQRVEGSVTYLFYPTLQSPEVDATRAEIETAYDRQYLRG